MNRVAAMTGQSSGFSQFSSAQSHSHVQFFVTPWAAACQASLSITDFWGLLKLMFIELVMTSNHLILSSPPPTLNLSQHQGLFHWARSSHQVAKVLELQIQHQSFTTWVIEIASECESMYWVIHTEMLTNSKLSPELNNILQDDQPH